MTGQVPESGSADAAPPRIDNSLRNEMLFRRRRDEGHEVSIWWPIAAFLTVSTLVVLLLGWVPGGA